MSREKNQNVKKNYKRSTKLEHFYPTKQPNCYSSIKKIFHLSHPFEFFSLSRKGVTKMHENESFKPKPWLRPKKFKDTKEKNKKELFDKKFFEKR